MGDTYTILLTGDDTAGRYTLIDMHVPPGGGPPPHRHDFEEMFTVLDGEIEVTFRGATTVARAGDRQRARQRTARLAQRLRPAGAAAVHVLAPGQEDFFMAIGVPVASRTEPPPSSTRPAERHSSPKPKNWPPNTGPSFYKARQPRTLELGIFWSRRDQPRLYARQVRPPARAVD